MVAAGVTVEGVSGAAGVRFAADFGVRHDYKRDRSGRGVGRGLRAHTSATRSPWETDPWESSGAGVTGN